MAKKVIGIVRLQVPAGKANPAPPIGPALGAQGVNIMAFCKEFNAATADKAGLDIPVVITVYADHSFTFILKSPPAAVLLKKAAGAVAVYVLVAVVGRLLFASTSRDWSGEEFTPEIWSSCQRMFHLVPGADLRPVGLRAERWLDAMAQAKFVTDETDLARLFDTNAVDLSGVVPGGTASNIRPIGRDGPRWWTPSDAPLQAGKLAFRDPEEAARANCEVAVHALPDGSRALYVFWFTD